MIQYDPSGSEISDASKVEAVAYLASSGLPEAVSVPLNNKDGIWVGKVTPAAETKAVFFKFTDGKDADGNKEVPMTLLYKGDQAVAGAYAAAAQIYSGIITLMGGESSTDKALEWVEKEMKVNPESSEDQEIYRLYASYSKRSDNADGIADVEAKIAELTKKKKASEEDLYLAWQLANALRNREQAGEINDRMLERYPDGKASKQAKFSAFNNAQTPEEMEKIYLSLLEIADEDNQNTMDYYANRVAGAYGIENRAKFDKFLNRISTNAAKARLLNSIAWPMTGESIDGEAKDLETAEELSAKSLSLVKEAMDDPKGKPSYLTAKEYKDNMKRTYGMYADTYALIQYKLGNYEKALDYQSQYVNSGYSSAEANELYCVYLEKVKGKEAAIQRAAEFIESGDATENLKERFVGMLASMSAEEAAGQTLAILENQARKKSKEKMREDMIDEEAPQFTLKNLKGEDVSLADLKGKTVILDFWATWCGPCIASFPGMQTAVNKYQDDPSVEFLFVDTWENGENEEEKFEKVSKFIEKKEYNFHVIMDTADKVVAAYGIRGIPTKFVIGPDGRIKFRKIGGGAAGKLIDELYSMIELVQEDAGLEKTVSQLD